MCASSKSTFLAGVGTGSFAGGRWPGRNPTEKRFATQSRLGAKELPFAVDAVEEVRLGTDGLG